MRKALVGVLGVAFLASLAFVWLSPVLRFEDASRSEPEGSGLDAAWRRVLESPKDPEAWAALGDAQAADDELEGAEHAYRTAVRLGGGDGMAFARLGFLLYQKGEMNDALGLLKEAKRRSVEVPMLDYTIETIEAEIGTAPEVRPMRGLSPTQTAETPSSATPSDAAVAARADVEMDAGYVDAWVPEPTPTRSTCTVDLERSSDRGVYLVDVSIGDVVGRLIVDTGASMTVLSARYVEQLGVAEDHVHTIRAMTANGQVVFPTAVVSRVTIGGRTLDESRVAVCSDCVEGLADGLIGLDLQAAFGLELDLVRGVLRLPDCE